jgi:uncharacterized membrane protein YecN with MAPEG domain
MPIATVTAGVAGLINVWLSFRISQIRRGEKISVGDGGNLRLIARMRAQANFIEYTPIVLILIALIEFEHGYPSPFWLWIVAALFILGRLLHPLGMDGARYCRPIATTISMLTTAGLGLFAVLSLHFAR